MRIASSTAWRLSTGSAPGSPSVTGSMFVLGSSPKRFGEPENSLVAVASSVWTSRPTTISHVSSKRTTGRDARSVTSSILQGLGDAEHRRLAERGSEDLHADGQAAGTRPERDAHAGIAGEVGRD